MILELFNDMTFIKKLNISIGCKHINLYMNVQEYDGKFYHII